MEKLTAKSYIVERIKRTQTSEGRSIADSQAQNSSLNREDLAKYGAQQGNPVTTASHLLHADTLSISQMGEILATSYMRKAKKLLVLEERFPTPTLTRQSREIPKLMRIAQGLTRAAKRVQNS